MSVDHDAKERDRAARLWREGEQQLKVYQARCAELERHLRACVDALRFKRAENIDRGIDTPSCTEREARAYLDGLAKG